MNTKALLTASAVFLGAVGIICSFLPHELLTAVRVRPDGIVPLLVQLLGASMFAFAMVNWTARGSLLGGIYNRPVALGNFTHFVVGALALTKVAVAGERQRAVIVLAIVYITFAAGFIAVLFRSPVKRGDAA